MVELTHLATLYHDDVMDEAAVRRGAPSANSRWTNSVAILVGDYLFARAADIAAELGPEAVRMQARTFARLVHGQIAETVGPRGSDPIAHYLHVIAEKTGSLIATSARFGGHVLAAPRPSTSRRWPGTARRSASRSSSPTTCSTSPRESVQSGKTPGTDLREGVPTLPVLYALAGDDTDAVGGAAARDPVAGPVTDDALHAEALGLLRESAAMKRARETVRTLRRGGPGPAGAAAGRLGRAGRWSRCATSSPTAPAEPTRRQAPGRSSDRGPVDRVAAQHASCRRTIRPAGGRPWHTAATSPHGRVAGRGRHRTRAPAVRRSRPRTRRSG